MRLAALALVASLLAGCSDAPEPRYGFGGAFRADATADERRELLGRLHASGARVEVTADEPTSHFGAEDLAQDACEDLHAWVAARPYVARAWPCAVDPNEA